MREMIMGAAAITAAGGAYYTYEPGEVYNMPVEQVATTLETLAIPEELNQFMGEVSGADVSISRKGVEKVTWTFSLNGLKLGEFHANLFAKDANTTRVTVGFELPEDGIGKHTAETPLQSNLVKNLAELALTEQVDSVLEKRDYNSREVASNITTYLITHGGEVVAFGKEMQSYAEKVQSGKVESIGTKMMRDPKVISSMEQSIERNSRGLSTEEKKDMMDRMSDSASGQKVRYSD